MTKKRFTLTFDDKIVDNLTGIIHDVHSGYDVAMDLSGLLNRLNDENEQLKQSYTKLEHRHSLLHDECLDAECDRDSYHKDVLSLEKENEQLKQRIRELEIENQGQSDAIDGLQEIMAHYDLEDLE